MHPSWILFSDGFKASRSRDLTKRVVDLVISVTLAVVMAPFMLLTALAIVLESGFPILYSQDRVGARGRCSASTSSAACARTQRKTARPAGLPRMTAG